MSYLRIYPGREVHQTESDSGVKTLSNYRVEVLKGSALVWVVFTLAEPGGPWGPAGKGAATLGEGGQACVCPGSLRGARWSRSSAARRPACPAGSAPPEVVMTSREFKQFSPPFRNVLRD